MIKEYTTKQIIENKEDILYIKKLIYQNFLKYNISDASEEYKTVIKNVYSNKSNIESTISYFKKNTDIFIYYDNKEIVWVLINKQNKITHLFVDINHQNKWIGKALMTSFEKSMKEKWYSLIYLKSSKYAYSFYEKHWFSPKGNVYMEKHI